MVATKQKRRAAPETIWVLHNTDYDPEPGANAPADASAVATAAAALCRALVEDGRPAELVGLHGRDLPALLARLAARPPDLVFNLCESLAGDARHEIVLPAVLDLMGVPYTGPGSLALGLCLHKDRTKDVLLARGIATPPYALFRSADELDRDLDHLPYPCFLKLAHEDASVGIASDNCVSDARALRRRALALLTEYRQPVLAERFVVGREVNVTLIGNGAELVMLPPWEIDFSNMPAGTPHIISYAGKWDESHPEYRGSVPVPLREATTGLLAAIEETARAAFDALGLRDFGRVDLRLDGAGKPWVIDVNPNCDLSPGAGVARTAAAAGLDYPQLVGRICEIAWKRHVEGGNPAARGH